jgi:hypothetical protein
MVWLLIIFCLAVAVSPLLWMKSSPRQQQVMACRKKARSLNLNVTICRQPDALDSEKRLDAVRYDMAWQADKSNQSWILHRRSNRGWDSCFEGWRWLEAEADPAWLKIIGTSLETLPLGVSAIVVSQRAIGVIWDERGDADLIENVHYSLNRLRKKGEEICT